MSGPDPGPPAVAVWLLTRILPRELCESFLGDLEERFHETKTERGVGAARRAYWREALATPFGLRDPGSLNHQPNADQSFGMTQMPHMLTDLAADLRRATRALHKNIAFTTAAVLTLALGIGANSGVFNVLYTVLLRPLPFPAQEQLVSVWGRSQGEYEAIRERARSYTGVGAYATTSVGLSGDGDAERVDAARVSASLFPTLGSHAAHGRLFRVEEEIAGSDRVVILSDALWRRRYGADTAIVGKTVEINGIARTVVGVMDRGFRYPSATTQLWTPLVINHANAGDYWGSGGYHIVGRLSAGATAASATRELLGLTPAIRRLNSVWDQGPTYGAGANIVPLLGALVSDSRSVVLTIYGAALAVLLIACVNVANLFLVRVVAREREFAIRSALGGGRFRLVRQLFVESMLLSVIAGVVGGVIAAISTPLVVHLAPAGTPRLGDLHIDAAAIAMTAAITCTVGIVLGLVSVVHVLRASPARALGTASRGSSAGRVQQKVAGALVVGEIAMALTLVVVAMLLGRSFSGLRDVDPGFRSERLATARVSLPSAAYADESRQRTFYADLLTRIEAQPSVDNVAAVDRLPLGGSAGGLAVRVEGIAEDIKRGLPGADYYATVTSGYFATMGIGLVAGRDFGADDQANSAPVVVVSEAFAKEFWPNESAIGKRVGYPWASPWMTIVGIVKNVRADSLRGARDVAIYRPFAQAPTTTMTVVVRTSAGLAATGAMLQREVRALNPATPVSDVRTLHAVVGDSIGRERFAALLVATFGALALLLGAIGIYGVLSHAVSQRVRELGVRMALGATLPSILGLVMRRGFALTAGGIVVGAVGAVVAGRAIASSLYGVSPYDPLTFAAVPVLLVIVAAAASYVPARRAARVDPMIAMRAE